MNIATLLPFILIIGVMLLMTRSAKNKQRQAQHMRDQMQPGSGVRTIGGMVALVKEVRDTTVLLEVAPGVHSIYAKTAVGAVLSDEEYDRIVNHDEPLSFDEHTVADATPVDETEAGEKAADEDKIDLGKAAAAETESAAHDAGTDAAEDAPESTDTPKDAKDGGK